jgi:hypothetical protein
MTKPQHIMSCGCFVIICCGFVITCGDFVIICCGFVITCGDFVILCGEFVIICGVVSLYVVGLSFCVMAYIRCVYLSVSSVSFVILYSRLFSGDSYLVMNGVCFSPHKLL